MRISVWSQEITQQAATQVPVIALWRPTSRGGDAKPWHILQKPVSTSIAQSHWTLDRKSSQIRVPMFPYRLTGVELDVLARFGIQIGAIVANLASAGRVCDELVIVHSKIHPRDDGQPGYQLWLGVAAAFEGS